MSLHTHPFSLAATIATIGAALLSASSAAFAANGYTALKVELSPDNTHWSQNLETAPGSLVNVRIVAGYEGRASLHGLAWINFQPTIDNWWGDNDQVMPFLTTGNQSQGAVAFDKPEGDQAAYGRIYPYAATTQGPSTGGFDTTLTTFKTFFNGTFVARIAQARTTNNIGEGPASGFFAFNNTNGVGGIVCSQPPIEESFSGTRNTLNQGIVLFKFAITVDPSLSERDLQVSVPVGGVSKFGQALPSAGWFTTAQQSAASISYIPVETRAGIISVRGPVPTPSAAFILAAGFALLPARRRKTL